MNCRTVSKLYINWTKNRYPAYWIGCQAHNILKEELLTTVFFIWIVTAVILAVTPPVIWNTVVVFTLEFMRPTSLFLCNGKNPSLHCWLPRGHPHDTLTAMPHPGPITEPQNLIQLLTEMHLRKTEGSKWIKFILLSCFRSFLPMISS